MKKIIIFSVVFNVFFFLNSQNVPSSKTNGEEQPKPVEIVFNQEFEDGAELFQLNKPLEAIPIFEKLIDDETVDPSIWVYLGISYYQIGEYEKSLELCVKGLSKQNTNHKILAYNAGNSAFAMGNYVRADACYAIAMNEDPSYASPVLNRANAQLKQDKLDEARLNYISYLELSPETPQRENIELIIKMLEKELEWRANLKPELVTLDKFEESVQTSQDKPSIEKIDEDIISILNEEKIDSPYTPKVEKVLAEAPAIPADEAKPQKIEEKISEDRTAPKLPVEEKVLASAEKITETDFSDSVPVAIADEKVQKEKLSENDSVAPVLKEPPRVVKNNGEKITGDDTTAPVVMEEPKVRESVEKVSKTDSSIPELAAVNDKQPVQAEKITGKDSIAPELASKEVKENKDNISSEKISDPNPFGFENSEPSVKVNEKTEFETRSEKVEHDAEVLKTEELHAASVAKKSSENAKAAAKAEAEAGKRFAEEEKAIAEQTLKNQAEKMATELASKMANEMAEKAFLEAEKSRIEAENARLDAERNRLEAEKLRLDAERISAEALAKLDELAAERARLAAENAKLEVEKEHVEAERLRLEAERLRLERAKFEAEAAAAEKAKAEREAREREEAAAAERARNEAARLEAEKARREAENAAAEKGRYDAERAQLEAERSKVESEKAKMEAERLRLEAEKAQLEIERTKVDAQRSVAAAEAKAAEAAAARAREDEDRARDRLEQARRTEDEARERAKQLEEAARKEYENKVAEKVEIKINSDGSVDINIPTLAFKKNSFELVATEQNNKTLTEVYNILNDEVYSKYKVVITGYVNPDNYIWTENEKQLALNRAKAVEEYLIKLGVNPSRLDIQHGDGKTSSSEYNRRVEFKLTK